MRTSVFASWSVVLAWLAGCGYEPAPLPPSPSGPPAPVAAQRPASPAPAAPQPQRDSGLTTSMTAMGGAIGMAPLETAVSGPMGVAPVQRPPQAQPTPPPPAPPPSYQKADVGVGVKGRGYGGGLITEPVSQYFRLRESIAFRIQIPHAMQLYKATNGSAPRTHEEFMEKIIKENGIRLPDLEPDERYVYDPQREELMVEHPGR
ncbi:MAG: hypothetical protein ACUVUC_15420 [Thermoguttaceae bacterium]